VPARGGQEVRQRRRDVLAQALDCGRVVSGGQRVDDRVVLGRRPLHGGRFGRHARASAMDRAAHGRQHAEQPLVAARLAQPTVQIVIVDRERRAVVAM
jgi:hypothetical protein